MKTPQMSSTLGMVSQGHGHGLTLKLSHLTTCKLQVVDLSFGTR